MAGKKQKDPRGRPTVDTPETRQKIEEATALDASIEEVAFWANISRETYYQIIKKDKVFSDRLDALRNRPVLKARQTVVQALNNPVHAFEYLKRKRKAEFSERLEQTGADGQPLMGNLLDDLENLENGKIKTKR